jgi:hypothetical protein
MRRPTSPAAAASLLPLFVALLAGVVGCGDTRPGFPTPVALFQAIDARVALDKTVAFTMTANGTGPKATDQGSTTVDGVIRVEKPVPSVTVKGRTQAGGEPAVDLEFVSLPDGTYVRLPDAARGQLPAGKSWLRVSDGGTDSTSQRFTAMVGGIRDIVTPAAQLARYVDAMTIEEAATEMVDGVSCTRYKLRVDLSKTAEIASDPRIQATARQLLGTGMHSYVATLWADDQNRVRRVAVVLGRPTDPYGYATEVRYRDWGKAARIDTPPPDEVSVVS